MRALAAALGAVVLAGCGERSALDRVGPASALARNARARWSPADPSASVRYVEQDVVVPCFARLATGTRLGERLDPLREHIEPACHLRALPGAELRWQITCLGRDEGDRDRMEARPGDDRVGPREQGIYGKLREFGRELAGIEGLRAARIAVFGGVDRQRLQTEQHGCGDLNDAGAPALRPLRPIGGAEHARASWSWRDGDAGAANDRLAYCRSARVGHAIGQGFLSGNPADGGERPALDLSVLGVSTAFFGGAACASARDGGTGCAYARRVELVLELTLDPVRRSEGCDAGVGGSPSEVALRCLQRCMDLRGAVLASPGGEDMDASVASGEVDVGATQGWYFARMTQGVDAGGMDGGANARSVEPWILRTLEITAGEGASGEGSVAR
jgi:hypothetical protein